MADNEKMDEIKDTAKKGAENLGTYQFAEDVKLKECKYCCVMIPKKAKICPNCKMTLKKRWKRKVLVMVLLLGVLTAAAAGGYYYLYEYQPAQETTAVVEEPDLDAAQTENAAMKTDAAEEQVTSVSQADMADTNTADNVVELPRVLEVTKETDTAEEILEEEIEPTEEIELEEEIEPTEEMELPEEIGLEAEILEETELPEGMIIEEGDEEAKQEEPAALLEAAVSQIPYKDMIRKQADYADTEIVLEVIILSQVDGGLFDDHIYYLCTDADKQENERYYIVRDDRTEEELLLLEGDVLRIRATLFDRCKLSADLVKTRPTVPALAMTACELVEE